MNALFDRFHNFILPLVRGEEGVCGCTCGRHQVYHVVPYNTVGSGENNALSDIMTRQEMNVIVGLLSGLCISFFLQWLDIIWHSQLKYWRANPMNGVSSWSWMPKFSTTRELFRRLHPQHTEDSRKNILHINQDECHHVNYT